MKLRYREEEFVEEVLEHENANAKKQR